MNRPLYNYSTPPGVDEQDNAHASAPVKSLGLECHGRFAACAKAIIVGEHAVVYGVPAIAIPIRSLTLSLEVYAANKDEMEIVDCESEIASELENVWVHASRLLKVPTVPKHITPSTSIRSGAGLGSSAALCAAVLRAVAQIHDIQLTSARLAEYCNRLEARYHGTPSGLDASVVAHEEAILFRKGKEPQPLAVTSPGARYGEPRVPWQFVLIDSRRRASTKDMVSMASPFFTGEDAPRILEAFEAETTEAAAGLLAGNENQLAGAMDACHKLLEDVGVVTEPLEKIVRGAKNAGCLSAKVTGAGGGGCVLALLPSKSAELVLNQLYETFPSNDIYEAPLD